MSQYDGKKAVDRAMAHAYDEAAIEAVAAKFKKICKLRNEPRARLLRFIEALQRGMKPAKAAFYFLDLAPERYAELIATNDELAFLIKQIQGSILESQYAKIVGADGHQAALRYVESEDPDFRPNLNLGSTIKNLSDDQVLRLLAQLAGDRGAQEGTPGGGSGGDEPAAGIPPAGV